MDYLNMHATTTTFREGESIHKHWFSKFKFRERIELFIRKKNSYSQNERESLLTGESSNILLSDPYLALCRLSK